MFVEVLRRENQLDQFFNTTKKSLFFMITLEFAINR